MQPSGTWRSVGRRWSGRTAAMRCGSGYEVAGSAHEGSGASSNNASERSRTRSAIHTRRTFSRAAPTCAACKISSDTRNSRRLSYTLRSRASTYERHMSGAIHVHERGEDELAALWERFKSDGDQRAREGLILHFSPLVKFVAGRLGSGLPRNVDPGDLVSYGTFGLIDAIDKFEPERGYKFETYAVNRIKGAILDELRALDWVPRSVRARAREIQRSMSELEHALQRSATDQELADHMDMPLETLRDQLGELSTLGFVALDELLNPDERDSAAVGDVVPDQQAFDPSGAFEREETRYLLADSINRLPERDRLVVTLYYFEGLTLAEIGTVLDVTESRVCQIHTKAVLSLRNRFIEPSF